MQLGQDIGISFPDCYLVHHNLPGKRVGRQRWPRHALFVPLQGEVTIGVQSGALACGPGRMIYVPPETTMSFQSSKVTGERLICLIDLERWRAATPVRFGATLCNAHPLCNEILFYLLLHPGSGCVRLLVSILVQVLAESIESVERPSLLEVAHLAGSVRDGRIRTALEIFRLQFATPIRMRDEAHQAGVSVRNLSRLFLAQIGLSPKQVLIHYRIAAAQEHLLAGDSVTEAAFSSGYGSLAQFVMTFRRVTGRLPSEIARHGRKQ